MNQTYQDTYIPFQSQTNQANQNYVPFQDGILNNGKFVKFDKFCEYCGANMRADCHAHAKWCPYHCNVKAVPIGGISIILSFLVIYMVVKKFFIKKR
jgi:hypothetical protein